MKTEPVAQTGLLYGKNEAAWLLGISPRSLDYLVATKRLGAQQVGKRVMSPNSSPALLADPVSKERDHANE